MDGAGPVAGRPGARHEAARYLGAALATGLVAVWGSEHLFWSAPPVDLDLLGWLLTWVAYSTCCAAVLSAVRWSGLGGRSGLMLGGALLGFLVEGVVVGTMYDAFPFQVVWTPLAWHALVTSVAVLGLARHGPRLSLAGQATAAVGLGAAAGLFGAWWPLERGTMPGAVAVLGYLVGVGLGVPLAQVVLDRLGSVPAPSPAVAWAAPALLAVVWAVQTVLAPSPQRLAFPVVVCATLAAMKRLGDRAGAVRGTRVSLGAPAPVARHLVLLLAPLTAIAVLVPVWATTGGVPTHLAVALVTGVVSLVWWLALLVRAVRPAVAGPGTGRPVSPAGA